MKKLALVLVFILIAPTAFAQWGQNNVGVYFDAAATSNYVDGVLVGELVHCYVVGTGLTASAVSGFELKLVTEGSGALLSNTIGYPTQAANLANKPDEYVVGFDGPIPASGGQFVFMEYDCIVSDTYPVCIYIEPIYFASIPGSCAYLGETPETLLPLSNSTGDPTNPNGRYAVASINGLCEGAVPTADSTWGSVKGLYR